MKIEIKPYHEKYDDEVVNLLKTTLGNSSTKKNIEFWRWKHICNPFGQSIILLAFYEDKLVGLRAFMRWNFSNCSEQVKAVRAVDTAVHPQFQGKGIFTLLTKETLIICKQQGIQLVYNTPNKKSKAGYLKMGWLENGRVPIKFSFRAPLYNQYNEHLINELVEKNQDRIFDFKISIQQGQSFTTTVSHEYLKWRYTECPIFKYGILSSNNEYLIIYRVKKLNKYCELRICDIHISSSSIALKNAIIRTKILIKNLKPLIITCAHNTRVNNKYFRAFLFSPSLKIGPENTLKHIEGEAMKHFMHFDNWQPSLGCLELF